MSIDPTQISPLLDAPVRLGVIGCGNVLGAYLPICQRLVAAGHARLIAACGRASQRDLVLQSGIPHFTLDERELLEDPAIDVLLILTSMNEHYRIARAALEAGKHLLVEKPLATSLSEADTLIDLAVKTGRRLVCAPFTTLSPTFQTLSARIQGGAIGKPCLARARYGWTGPDWTEWFYKPGGGCLFDLGVYCLTSLTGLLGPARRVSAMTGIAIPTREIHGRSVQVEAEDNVQLTLDFGGGTLAVVTCGFTMQQYRGPALEVYGSTGTIQMLGDDWDPEGYELFQNHAGCWQVFKETHPDWPWADGLNHLVHCLRAGIEPLLTPHHARHVLEIMIKAQQSGREGRAFELQTTFPLQRYELSGTAEPVHRQHDRSRDHSLSP